MWLWRTIVFPLSPALPGPCLAIRQPVLGLFTNVLLVSSSEDRYVPHHSARLQLCEEAVHDLRYGATFVSMVHHILEPHVLSTAKLEELANVKIKGRESEILAHVALPSEPPGGPLPVLIVIHEFFGLSEFIT